MQHSIRAAARMELVILDVERERDGRTKKSRTTEPPGVAF